MDQYLRKIKPRDGAQRRSLLPVSCPLQELAITIALSRTPALVQRSPVKVPLIFLTVHRSIIETLSELIPRCLFDLSEWIRMDVEKDSSQSFPLFLFTVGSS
jgi:hypothetical protein